MGIRRSRVGIAPALHARWLSIAALILATVWLFDSFERAGPVWFRSAESAGCTGVVRFGFERAALSLALMVFVISRALLPRAFVTRFGAVLRAQSRLAYLFATIFLLLIVVYMVTTPIC